MPASRAKWKAEGTSEPVQNIMFPFGSSLILLYLATAGFSFVFAMGFTYYDFFAGGGVSGIGLGPKWTCTFANDFDEVKAVAYRGYHGGGSLVVKDIRPLVSYCSAALGYGHLCPRLFLAWPRLRSRRADAKDEP